MTRYRTFTVAFLAAGLLAVSLATCFRATGDADIPGSRFDQVQVVVYPTGLTGFFNQQDGMLYIYDAEWNRCITIRRVTALGKPMTKLRGSDF